MIEGIEVLNTYKVDEINLIGCIFIFLLGVTLMSFIIGVTSRIEKFTGIMMLTTMIIALVILVTLGHDKITTYEVTISDEVSMTEFYEKYEVVDQKGKIFVIRERKEKNNDKTKLDS